MLKAGCGSWFGSTPPGPRASSPENTPSYDRDPAHGAGAHSRRRCQNRKNRQPPPPSVDSRPWWANGRQGDSLIRHDLCFEALRLGRLLARSSLVAPRVHALVALMALQAARLGARVDEAGDL